MTMQPDLFAASAPVNPVATPAPRRGKSLYWFEQPFETRAKAMESAADDAEDWALTWAEGGERAHESCAAEQVEFHLARADHLRALAQRMRTEKRPLA